MWEQGKRKQVLDGRRRRRCRMCYEERETIQHMWNGCSEIRERERKERGEILNEDGREMDERNMEEKGRD
jgi:hypothetical protein